MAATEFFLRQHLPVFCSALLATLLVVGCAHPPPYRSDFALAPGYHLSRDGILRYAIPLNWLDATNDRIRNGNTEILLVREDYDATISATHVTIDQATRRELSEDDRLINLAHALVGLLPPDKRSTLIQSPRTFQLNGRTFVAYEIAYLQTGDTVRTVLMDTGQKIYELNALAGGSKRGISSQEIFRVQQSFLSAIRW